ncbi:MAG: Mo-dependent nitrogenase C-terminal domain-containing protein [Crocosphaera sp.]
MVCFSDNNQVSKGKFGFNANKTQDYLLPLRQYLNNLEIQNESLAHILCRLIPVQCPFARDIKLFGRTIGHIPPLCKLNPLYDEIIALRFRALSYLADECGQDVSCYC